MRIFAISDIHIDYPENLNWFNRLSQSDYKDDILILAGDIADSLSLLEKAFTDLKNRFLEVLYVPGNHDLWVERIKGINSFEKFALIKNMCDNSGVLIKPLTMGLLSIVPLLGWYDYSFGAPADELKNTWVDYYVCKWPENFDQKKITDFFIAENELFLDIKNKYVITFSHFLPRVDIMPSYIPSEKKRLYPVLGTFRLAEQILQLEPNIHIYGHSHVKNTSVKNNTTYINNAYGYPHETWISEKGLKCIFEI